MGICLVPRLMTLNDLVLCGYSRSCKLFQDHLSQMRYSENVRSFIQNQVAEQVSDIRY